MLHSNYNSSQLMFARNFCQEDTEEDSMVEENLNATGDTDKPPSVFYPKVTIKT